MEEGNSKLVAVTGCRGYLGHHLTAQLISRGFRVRGTVRNLKAPHMERLLKLGRGGKLELHEVDLAKPDADVRLARAFTGCSIVFHTASFVGGGRKWRGGCMWIMVLLQRLVEGGHWGCIV